MEVDGEEDDTKESHIRIFHPFHPDYLPNELISKLFSFLDNKSHGDLETCNKRMLIISRNPSSNLFLGGTLDTCLSSMDESGHLLLGRCPTLRWALSLKERDTLEDIMAKAHQFKRVKRLCLLGDNALPENN